MKILQVVTRYAPAWAYGGPVRISYDLGRELIKRGHEVTAYTSDSISPTERSQLLRETLDGIVIRRFRNPINYLSARMSFLFYRPRALKTALAREARNFDIIHVMEARGRLIEWATEILPGQGKPFIWSAYGGLASGIGMRYIYRRFYDKVANTTRSVKSASALIAQTEHEAQTYKAFGTSPDKIYSIPLGLNWSEFEQLPAPGQFRKKLGLRSSEKLILFVGRIHQTKGLHLLIASFANAISLMPSARLVIVGWDHGYLSKAKQQVKKSGLGNKVIFHKPIYGKERFTAYVDADLFVMTPPVYEETSLAALEACACGTPCVLTRQCEIPGLAESKAGYLVECSHERISEALIEAIFRKADGWGQNARQMVQDKYTLSAIGAMHEELYKKIYGGCY